MPSLNDEFRSILTNVLSSTIGDERERAIDEAFLGAASLPNVLSSLSTEALGDLSDSIRSEMARRPWDRVIPRLPYIETPGADLLADDPEKFEFAIAQGRSAGRANMDTFWEADERAEAAKDLLGRGFAYPVADYYAFYRVEAVRGNQYLVRAQSDLSAYRAHIWGSEAVLPEVELRAILKGAGAMRAGFAFDLG